MKKNPYRYWINTRKIIQYISLLIFLLFLVGASSGKFPASFTNIWIRIDPLIALLQSIASRKIITGIIAGLFMLGLSFLFGRAWCGWICPLGTTLDLIPLKSGQDHKGSRRPEQLEKLRSIKYILLFTLITAALWGNLTFIFLDPLTILMRSFTLAIWPALDQVTRAGERFFYSIPLLAEAVTQFDSWVRPAILPIQPTFTRDGILFFSIFIGILTLNRLAPRFWCRYICPLGGLLGIISKISLLRREVSPDCKNCKLCLSSCPTGTIDENKGFASDPSECTLCLNCLDACPRSSIHINSQLKPAHWNPVYDPDRRKLLASALTATTAVAIFHRDWMRYQPTPFHLRPPGVEEDTLLSHCTRCGLCLRICPTGALNPASLDSGLEGLWTPLLVPRIGYCEYSCSACGDICPTQAIPDLAIEEKRLQIIGKAYIDQNRCIAWADNTDCIVCEEMCPLPEKAIYLEESAVIAEDGTTKIIQLPHVQRERCIGCGVCEYKCPITGEAAIRVRTNT